MSSSPSVWLTTLGCAKNQVDSEKVQMMLAEAGYTMATSADAADVVMVNTCAFIEEARRESVDTILDAQDVKRTDAKTVVIGCMAQRFGVEVEEALPEVDAVVGLDRYGELIETIDQLTGNWAPVQLKRRPAMDILNVVRRPTPTMPYAYVKVAEGCDKPCTFCAIPLIRGAQRSRRPIEIRDEVHGLVAAGVQEVVLVAQDLAAYGRDVDDSWNIVDLIRFVSEVDGLHTARLLYLYPKEIRPGLIDEIAANGRIASYFDLSLQHASRELLRGMKRPGDGERYRKLIDDIRSAAPDATLRSSFIVGFPGETEGHVEELAEFLEDVRLDWAGFFPYSLEQGTAAADLGGQIDRPEIEDRLRHLQAIQDEITADANLATLGDEVVVLIDQVEDGVPVGRSMREAPEIDGMITLDTGVPGELVHAEVVGAFGPDRQARVCR